MNDARKDFIRRTSVPLPDGGDTHVDPWENGRGFTVTTRLPGGFDDHVDFRFKDMIRADPSGLAQLPW